MIMKKMKTTARMYEVGALAIVRVETLERACEIADGCIKGGVPVMEMSYTLNNAGTIIEGLKQKYGDALCVGGDGAGSGNGAACDLARRTVHHRS